MKRTILLVEDDENDAFFMKNAFQKAGIANPLYVARDGQIALDYMEGAGPFANRGEFPLPCIILLDLKLPRVMGLDVLKALRKERNFIPVLVMTSSKYHTDIEQAYEFGANAYLLKPPDSGKLLETVKAIRDFWLAENIPSNEVCVPRAFAAVATLAGRTSSGSLESP